jgi:hypothetical protein
MDLQVGRTLTRNLESLAAAENPLDQRYEAARTPVVNLWASDFVSGGGLRLNFSAAKQ